MAEAKSMPCRCLCGAVRFSVTPQKNEMGVCHCAMCRRWSGGVFMAVECSDLAMENGDDLRIFASSEWAERGFCGVCGSSLFWRMREEKGGLLAVAFQSFEDTRPFAFTEEIFIEEKPPQYHFAGERARKTGAEIMAAFGAKQAN